MRNSDWCFESKYVIFYWSLCFNITYNLCGYFDNRPRIELGLIFFRLTLILPFKNKWEDECSAPRLGIAIHNNTFWLYKGGKGNGRNEWWTWDIPFFTHEWVRRSVYLKDYTWESESPKNRKEFYEDHWKKLQKSWDYIFTDYYDNELIPTKIYLEEKEWRPKWLTWTKLFSKIRTSISIEFSREVGRGKGSYKGGTLGCSYTLKRDETPIEGIIRMEKERKV